jgi:hypothetical protein
MTMRRWAALLLAALPLWGQEAAFGLKGYGMLTVSDLRDLTSSPFGFGGGVFVEIPLDQAFRLRPYVGLQEIPSGNTVGLPGTKTGVSSVDLMLDALWFPGEVENSGPYLVGSFGGHLWKVGAVGTNPSNYSVTRLGLGGGIGYQVSPHLGAEVRGFWSPIRANLTATGLTVGVTWRY